MEIRLRWYQERIQWYQKLKGIVLSEMSDEERNKMVDLLREL